MLPQNEDPEFVRKGALVLAVFVTTLLLRWWVSSSREMPTLFPAWAPIEIAITSYLINRGGIPKQVLTKLRRYGGPLFGLTSSHQILASFPGADRLLAQSAHTLNTEPIQFTLLTRVFGATRTPELQKKLQISSKELLTPLERVFLNDAAATAALERADVAGKTASLVSFSDDPRSMMRWELSAGVRVLQPESPEKRGAVEANLQSLSRDFGACISIPQLYGQDFLDRNPRLLDDLWKFDNHLFPLLIVGIPTWAPFTVMREGIAARARLAKEMEALYRRISQSQKGEEVDFGADMSDVSSAALGRYNAYEKYNWASVDRGFADLSLLWGQNANTQPVLFWLLTYVYSTAGLVEKLRKEMETYVTIEQSGTKLANLDIQGLSRNCPLLKACIFETYRLSVEAASIRYVERCISINDGKRQQQLRPGTFLSLPHGLNQRDPSVYAAPDTFVPERFLEEDDGKLVAKYGKLRPWGAGTGMCKGRTFAEREIIATSAAIISLWDIQPAGGSWKLPGMVPGTGVKKPTEDIRVLIKRRPSQKTMPR